MLVSPSNRRMKTYRTLHIGVAVIVRDERRGESPKSAHYNIVQGLPANLRCSWLPHVLTIVFHNRLLMLRFFSPVRVL